MSAREAGHRCPADPEEVAEGYCMGTLSPGEAAAFEEHYLACPACAGILENVDTYVRAIATAARRLRAADGSRERDLKTENLHSQQSITK
jgi:hypothetical protein